MNHARATDQPHRFHHAVAPVLRPLSLSPDRTDMTAAATTSPWPISIDDVRAAHARIAPYVSPSPLYNYPLLDEAVGHGIRVLVKHENFNPTNSFKVRNGLSFMTALPEARRELDGWVPTPSSAEPISGGVGVGSGSVGVGTGAGTGAGVGAAAGVGAEAVVAADPSPRPKRRRHSVHGNLEHDAASEGRIEPSTAALMEGAPPAGTSGRGVPLRRTKTGVHDERTAEGDTEHLPG